MTNRAEKCGYCSKALKPMTYISKDSDYLHEFCCSMCLVRNQAKLANKFILEDIVIEPFTKNGNYSIDVEWGYMMPQIERYQETYNLNLDPDFQRAHVWTEEQRIAYVEYLARGGYAGKEIYFNYPDWQGNRPFDDNAEMVIVDGKQRLNAAMHFLDNKFKIFGKYYAKDLYRLPSFTFSFKFYINSLKTRKEVLKWYLDLNTGGTPHTNEEINKVREMLKGEQ